MHVRKNYHLLQNNSSKKSHSDFEFGDNIEVEDFLLELYNEEFQSEESEKDSE